MIIKELLLLSFGKFNKKKIVLKDGINIIYGKNEAGKTTVHKFIEGMFFGFFRPYRKRRMYTEEHEKYTPMDSSEYYGILKYQYHEKTYRVERNFSKEKSELKVFDDQTGEELTNVFEYDNVTRLHDPSSIHLNLNRVMFSNTISIGQLDSKTDDELAGEVKDSLINMGSSLDSELSVDNVIGKLKQEIDDIGTEKRTKSSPYGKVIKRIEVLEQEKEKSYTALIETNEYTIKINKAREQLNQMIDDREELKEDIKNQDEYERYSVFCEIKTIEDEMKNLEEMLETDLDYKPIATQEYKDILRIIEKIKLSKQQVQNIIEKEKVLNKDIDLINDELKVLLKVDLNDQIDFDLYDCESKEEELSKLKKSKGQFSDSTQKDKISNISKDINSIKSKRILILCITPLLATLGVLNIKLLVIPVILTVTIFVFMIKEKDLKKKRIILEQLMEKAIYSERDLDYKIDKLENEICDILKRQSSCDLKELKEKRVSLERQKRLCYEKQSYNKQKQDLDLERDKLTIYYQDLKLDLEYLLEGNNLKDVNHLNDTVEKIERDKNILPTLESKRLILENLKSKVDLEKLNKEFEEFEPKTEEPLKKQELDKIKQDYQNKCEIISDKKSEIKDIEIKIENLQMSARNLVSIQEDINRAELEKRKYEEDLKSLNIAKDTLESVSKNIQREFSPKLNKLISDVISTITSKKYADVKVEENLSIKVIDNNGRLIDLSCLSGGTIDQVYFSTRVGIDKIIREGENLPLILDDTFIQYDDQRLENILKFLYKESLKRQIIIFTCQKREIKILDKLKLKYRLTKL